MKYLIFLSALFLYILTSCSNQDCCVNLDVGIAINIVNAKGENLLDKNVVGHIDPETLRVSYLINGEVKSAYNSNLDCASSICEQSNGGESWLSLLPNISESEAFPITYIQWNSTDTDTLKCLIYRNGGSTSCAKIWYNGLLVYPAQATQTEGRKITVIK